VVNDSRRVTIRLGADTLIDADIQQLKEAWQRPLR
jgi:hypothetical protein